MSDPYYEDLIHAEEQEKIRNGEYRDDPVADGYLVFIAFVIIAVSGAALKILIQT